MLHWANRDQYYVKTGEHFTDHRIRVGDTADSWHVEFRLQQAEMDRDNNKSDENVEGWIISHTPISDLRKQWDVDWDEAAFAKQHILFPQSSDGECIARLLTGSQPEGGRNTGPASRTRCTRRARRSRKAWCRVAASR